MQDKRVGFETAKLAKEKGFNIDCDWKIDEEGNEEFLYFDWIPNNSEYSYNQDKDPEVIAYEERGKRLINQPTQSLLQKWLREEHGLLVEIGYYNKEFLIDIFKKDDETFHFDCMHTTPVYELSLEMGLKEALKLIE